MEEEVSEVAIWLDKSLVKLASRFGNYSKDQPDSLQLPASFSMLPQWFYNLRRSPFMQVSKRYQVSFVHKFILADLLIAPFELYNCLA